MADRHDENLPEVVPDSSPQPLTSAEAYERRGLDEGEKYTVIYDLNTPKIVTSGRFVGDVETPTTPAPAYRAPVGGAAGAASATSDAGADVEDLGKSEAALGSPKGDPKILGLKRRTFFILLIIAVIIIAAGIGGGIGGSQAAAKQKASGASESAGSAKVAEEASSPMGSSPGESSDSASSAAGSTATNPGADESNDDESNDKPAKTSTSASPKPTSGGSGGSKDDSDDDEEEEEKDDDDNDDDDKPKPGFKFRGWKNAKFKGHATDLVATTGFLDLPFDVTSYRWKPQGTDCCVTMCQGKRKNVGWRCTSFDREEATAKFGRIFIGCGAEASEASSRCS